MKNKLFVFTLLMAFVFMFTSCVSSRSKYGCPPTAAYHYKPVHKS